MKSRSLLAAGALALATLSVASAKTWDIMLSGNVKAGSVQLAPGEYKVKVNGTNAVFTDVNNGKSTTTPVKIQNADKKHDQTAVETTQTNTGQEMKAIELGGSTETLEFGE